MPNAAHIHNYRPDIDGLRAIAVLAVVFYHAHLPGFSGGFVGVDIFFVISGYLITAIIAREIDEGCFTLTLFYERRLRRILPALVTVSVCVLTAAYWLYLPEDFSGVPPSVLAALMFSANLWFFTQAGYFQADAETMPMLHSWSLGVEEQFYIFFPLLLVLCHRVNKCWRNPAVIGLALISFIWAVLKQADTDAFAFYMLPTRGWELLAGSLIALGALPQIRQAHLREVVSCAGLAAILWPVFSYDQTTIFPGIAALPPVLGTAALIHCAPGTRVGALMSIKPAIWIGLISYSLYLWHWPIIVFWQYAQASLLSAWQPAAAILGSVIIAWLSWRFVEQPFRDKKSFTRKRIFIGSALATCLLGGISVALITKGGWPERFDEQTLRFARASEDASPVRDYCVTDRVTGHDARCVLGDSVPPSALLWGDSHGVELAWVMGEQLSKNGQSLIQRTRASCPPVTAYDDARDPGCALFNRDVLAQIEREDRIETVFLAGFWAKEPYREAQVDRLMAATLERLHAAGKQIYIIGPVPPQASSVPRMLAFRGPQAETTSAAEFEQRTRWFTRNFAEWRRLGVRIIEPADNLVRDGKSIIVANGHPLYFDSHHLSLAGAHYVLDRANWKSGTANNGTQDRDHRQQGADGASPAARN